MKIIQVNCIMLLRNLLCNNFERAARMGADGVLGYHSVYIKKLKT